jgi:hypothetical protein
MCAKCDVITEREERGRSDEWKEIPKVLTIF